MYAICSAIGTRCSLEKKGLYSQKEVGYIEVPHLPVWFRCISFCAIIYHGEIYGSETWGLGFNSHAPASDNHWSFFTNWGGVTECMYHCGMSPEGPVYLLVIHSIRVPPDGMYGVVKGWKTCSKCTYVGLGTQCMLYIVQLAQDVLWWEGLYRQKEVSKIEVAHLPVCF